jgi:hypothetical protein
MTKHFFCNFCYCFCETNPNPTIGFEMPYVLPLICFKRHQKNKHSILDNNINHSYIFSLVLEVVLLLSNDQTDHIHNDIHL